MPWTVKWIAAIVGTFVLLVIADRLWYIHEMKTLANSLGLEWSQIERRGSFPFEYYKKVVHYGMTRAARSGTIPDRASWPWFSSHGRTRACRQ